MTFTGSLMRKCSKCNEYKELLHYGKNRHSKDGLRPSCKACDKALRDEKKANDPIGHQISEMARGLLRRVNKPTGRNKCYEGVECRIGKTPIEVIQYLEVNFRRDIERLLAEGEIPSIDRIDSTGHYEHGNIRIITWYENSKMGAKNANYITSKEVIAYMPDGKELTFRSVSEASRELGVKRDTIINSAKKNKPSMKGILFNYK